MNATRPALASEQRPVALPLATPALPSDLFQFIGDWQQVGKTVERDSTRGRVSVTTCVDRWEGSKSVCSEFPFIDGERVDARKESAMYDTIIESADEFIEANQGDLFESWGSR